MSKPNIVFFFTDDQRFDTIHALGNDAIRTPNIDRLVERGTAFTHAHIPSGTSGAVCMPSRAMLHSGRSLFHIDRCGQQIPEEHTTLGQALQGNGYRTFGTGKWHNGRPAFNRSFSDGAEIMFGGMADHWNVPVYHYDPSGEYSTQLPYCVDEFTTKQTRNRGADHINSGVHSSEMVCNAGIDFIRKQDGPSTGSGQAKQPFFAYISFLAPHDPRIMPERFHGMYNPDDVELPPNFTGGHPFDNGALRIRDEELAAFPRTPEETREHIADYYAMITHLDHELGRVMQALEEQGILDNTIIVFAGDNGLAVGQHGLFGKQNCYEHSVRVPLIFAGPGIPEGHKTDAYAYLFDIFPTLCGLTGTPVPESVEGKDLIPCMESDAPLRDTLYFAYTGCQRAVKDHRHKLIEYAVEGRDRQTQLFDLVNDPWELTNLADNPNHADTIDRLRKELFRLRDEWDDQTHELGQTFWSRY
ncbi:MAG: sulfatase-like hydrolase/transferase [Kiritimatiellia bacterium]|jgi:arylsulfatase A-like enzyme|nr:sulfatase-like hydrolase/transferase [Kiritimatiellia bacterium]MDP6630759.1 sulfatase-like hydrolase/transferase [Kiritimatiellia bacterium]MDP6809378.1 sulfatase-like hydrolase/transferase [Kiritimatiellia bacterium]MDP7023945.1 sulfatase-like hydrolase/transferase [Kiritimatiellia bacterium]